MCCPRKQADNAWFEYGLGQAGRDGIDISRFIRERERAGRVMGGRGQYTYVGSPVKLAAHLGQSRASYLELWLSHV